MGFLQTTIITSLYTLTQLTHPLPEVFCTHCTPQPQFNNTITHHFRKAKQQQRDEMGWRTHFPSPFAARFSSVFRRSAFCLVAEWVCWTVHTDCTKVSKNFDQNQRAKNDCRMPCNGQSFVIKNKQKKAPKTTQNRPPLFRVFQQSLLIANHFLLSVKFIPKLVFTCCPFCAFCE